MAEEKDFKYDPEAEESTAKYRLPFALCKKYNIPIQSWWTPKNAWDALKGNGRVDTVSDEYREYYRKLKQQYNRESYERAKRKKSQLRDINHNPDYHIKNKKGYIAGVKKGKPMSFAEADSGNCNPYYSTNMIGYKTNCQTCVATYIARRQGYNVRALPNLNNKNIYDLSHNTALAYLDNTGHHPKQIMKPKNEKLDFWLESTILEGDIYSIEFDWKGRNKGHIITIERNKSGELTMYDPQTNKQISRKQIYSYLSRTRNISIMNLTNVTMDSVFCDRIMKEGKNERRD